MTAPAYPQPQREYIITGKQMSKVYNSTNLQEAAAVMDEIRDSTRPHTPAPELYKMQTDEDGAIGKVAVCLCDSCKVNGFLCTKSPRATTPYIPGKENINTYRCCEVCPNVPCKPLFRVNCTRQDPAAIARTATLALIAELQTWLEPQKLPLLKQKMWRKLESLRQSTTAAQEDK